MPQIGYQRLKNHACRENCLVYRLDSSKIFYIDSEPSRSLISSFLLLFNNSVLYRPIPYQTLYSLNTKIYISRYISAYIVKLFCDGCFRNHSGRVAYRTLSLNHQKLFIALSSLKYKDEIIRFRPTHKFHSI